LTYHLSLPRLPANYTITIHINMSYDLINQITTRLPSGTGIYLRTGDKVTSGVMYYYDYPATPTISNFFEIHTGTTHVPSLQDFWKTHVSTHQVENDGPTDQQLLERLSITFQPIEAVLNYPSGSSKTFAEILATTEDIWFRNQRRIDTFKRGAFDRIYEKLDFGTSLCYMELGYPPLYLTLEKRYSERTFPGNFEFRAVADQPAGIDLPHSKTFSHLNHTKNWYMKNVMNTNSHYYPKFSPLYNLYLVSGPYKGRNLGQLLDNSPWIKSETEVPELFPVGSRKDIIGHVGSIDYMLKKMEYLCKPCRVNNVIKIMKYLLGHSLFVNAQPKFKKTVLDKAHQFLEAHPDEPELVKYCQLVVQTYDPPNVVEVSSSSSSSSVAPIESNSSSSSSSSSATINEVVTSQDHPSKTTDEIIITLRRQNAELEHKNATLKAMLEAYLKTV